MADSVLLFDGELSHRLSILWQDKNWIISKSSLPYLSQADPPAANPIGHHFLPIGGDECHHTSEPRTPF